MDRLFDKYSSFTTADLLEGGFFLVNKPSTWTSFDVVNKMRFAIRSKLQKKKYKIGHSGTLDPLATGLLIICFSKYTKKIELMTGWDKVYTGSIRLWVTTPSYDLEQPFDTYFPNILFEEDDLNEARKELTGMIEQLPPMFSAIKKDGVPLYKLARKGIKTEVKSRKVEIKKFTITDISLPIIEFEISCSKGTYIRSVAYDFGKKLKSGGCLQSLVRTKIGDYELVNAWDLNELIERIQSL